WGWHSAAPSARSSGGAAREKAPMKPDSQPPEPAARIPEQDEAGLVARIRAGDRAAFGVLAERYAGVARRVAPAVLGDPDDADDAGQDALLSALVKPDQDDPRRPFRPWLRRVGAAAASDRRRRRRVRPAGPPRRRPG